MSKQISIFLSLAAAFVCSAAAEKHVIVQKNKTFSEKKIVVKVGDTVLFKNEDSLIHNVFSATPGLDFAAEAQLPGQASAVKFDKPGIVQVECAIHPNMKLTVEVQK